MESGLLGNGGATLRRSSDGVSHEGEKPGSHQRFLGLSVACVVSLNLLAAATKEYGLLHLTASATLLCSIYPAWRFFKTEEDNFPFFPLIALLYGLYYSIMAFVPFEPYQRLVQVQDESLLRASTISLVGIGILIAGYYGSSLPLRLPRLSLRWEPKRAEHLAVALGVLGAGMQVTRTTREVAFEWSVIVYYLAQLSVLSIGMLFYLFLERRLSRWSQLFL